MRELTGVDPQWIADNLLVGIEPLVLRGLVDFAQPDLQRLPKFAQALTHAQVAELEPDGARALRARLLKALNR
jgi:hypothetical protein